MAKAKKACTDGFAELTGEGVYHPLACEGPDGHTTKHWCSLLVAKDDEQYPLVVEWGEERPRRHDVTVGEGSWGLWFWSCTCGCHSAGGFASESNACAAAENHQIASRSGE